MAAYTTADKVKTRLLVPTNTVARPDPDNPGQMRQVDVWEGDFGAILTDCISAAEDMLDEYLGRTFRPATAAETKEYVYRGGPWLPTDDMNGEETITLQTEDDETIPSAEWAARPPFGKYNIRRDIRIRSLWTQEPGDVIKVTAHFGWPSVPPPIIEAATRAAAELYRAGEIRFGLIAADGMMGYAKAPMLAIFKNLRPFRTKSL